MTLLGQRVLISRRDLDAGQEEVARKANVSRTYVSKIERGKADGLTLEVVDRLASALGVSSAYLLGYTDDPLGGVVEEREDYLPGLDSTPLSPEEEELLSLIQQMTDEQRQQMLWGAKVLIGINRPSSSNHGTSNRRTT